MNVFNCILKNKATVVIPCFTPDCDVNDILDKLSEQYYAKGVNILIFNNKLSEDTLKEIEKKKYTSLNVEIVDDVYELYDNKTPHVFVIDDSSRLMSKWSLFNLINNSKKRRKLRKNQQEKIKNIHSSN